MEKEQLDSLQTVTVGSEKIPPPHSHYAPSEVYSSSESPPAYSRPVMKSTAVQIAKIIATTLITISVIIGSFILAAAWLQARASCTPEAINGMQTQINSQQEFIKHLQPEALVQDPIDVKQNIDESSVKTKQPTAEPKEEETQTDNQDDSKADNESANDNENDDDYNDSGFSPVHFKFSPQLDLDDLANTLMQQSRGLVSCVVERRRSDGFTDGNNQVDNNNNNDYQRPQRLSGERVVILCESGEPRRQEQQEQDLRTPIIVPLGNIQIPMQPHEQDYHRYQVQNQFSAPDVQTPPFVNARRINQLEQGISIPDIKNIAQMMGFGSPRMPPQMNHQQMELRPFPIEIRTLPIEVIRGMRPPMNQMEQHQPQPQQQQQPPQPQHPMFAQEPTEPVYSQEQQTQGMMPPPPPPSAPNAPELNQREPRIIPQVHIIQQQLEQKPAQPQEAQDKPNFPFPGLPIDIIRFIQQPENMEAHRQENVEGSQESTKLIADSENQEESKDDEDKKKIVVLPESSLIHQIEERLFPRSHFSMPMRSMDTFQIPMEVSARVMGNSGEQEDNKEQHQPMQAQVMPQSDEQEDASRPHYVQPRSIP
ncbi:Protein of unknown function [Cotesia congregata]|uniref:Uncharacterized protein n=1 Tax=Cotesia congregata TaxID=51543 RepID=A0A8J2H9J5_COTCN|nr:Protein of unknown function [Cotesia congregata]